VVIDEGDVRAVLRWDRLIAEMEAALTAFSAERVIQPVRNMITIEEGRRYLGVMPAVAENLVNARLVYGATRARGSREKPGER
jgi:thiomorpholine-carboxylate dehydrogenase